MYFNGCLYNFFSNLHLYLRNLTLHFPYPIEMHKSRGYSEGRDSRGVPRVPETREKFQVQISPVETLRLFTKTSLHGPNCSLLPRDTKYNNIFQQKMNILCLNIG